VSKESKHRFDQGVNSELCERMSGILVQDHKAHYFYMCLKNELYIKFLG